MFTSWQWSSSLQATFSCSSPSDGRYLGPYRLFGSCSNVSWPRLACLVLLVELSRTIVTVNLNFFGR